ncbi:MAG: lysine--tRNA ligase [Patescibacteria group bacterium]|jgi:lysyl-tRNA synthetase class 2
MGRLEETRDIRLKKLALIKELGIDPYPAQSLRTHSTADLANNYERLAKSERLLTIAGRIRSIRRHGGSGFVDVEDGTGHFQVFIKKDALGENDYRNFTELIDSSDVVEFTGKLFLTKQNTKTLEAKTFRLLTKSIRAIPESYFGLKDIETRLRKRYIDLAVNPESRELFVRKSMFWKAIRQFLEDRDFIEVQIPVFEDVPGGAEAEPFVTHHNALDRDFFLRISLELPLKRLLVGGFERVYEIGRIFRNEGISAEHLQDYTQMEFYWAYADYNNLQNMLIAFYRSIIEKTCGSLVVKSCGHEIDWGQEWKTYDYYQLFNVHAGINLHQTTELELKKKADELKIKYETYVKKGRLIDLIYKKTIRPLLIKPGFLINPPVEIEPLAKRMPEDPDRVQRLQVMAWGTELGKGFSELNDPIDQRQRFEDQMKLRQAGDTEAQQLDEDYIEALEYGLPPTAGFGLSERLFSVLMDRPIRETTLFPPMKSTDK